MCGINGFSFRDEELAKEMDKALVHRGPDSSGVFSDDNVTLGHQRLKIIDLSDRAAEPMSGGGVWLVFNGEIYNFQELRKELESLGYKFKSDTDAEVIIHGYRKWGYDCVKRFNGMWAFAIYDAEKGKLFLSRDRLGKKPLYYCIKDGGLIFSSEIKPLFLHGIEKALNKKAVSSYLSYRYVLGEESMFQGVYKLMPAQNLVFDIRKGGVERKWEYWDVESRDVNMEEGGAREEVGKLLKDAVAVRQVSDVPIGSINSGGLDSSVVSAIMASINKEPINTFTVKFPEKGYDETPFARLLARRCRTKHKEITIDTGNFLQVMEDYARKKDEPIGVPNEIALYMLFKEIKKSVTVILSGEGADEIFAGYSRIFRSPYDYERLKGLGKEEYKKGYPSLYRKYKGRLFRDEVEHFLFLYNYFPDAGEFLKPEARKDFEPIFREYFERVQGDYEKRMAYVFIKLHLPGLLARLDNSSMASAVEARCPFLDYRLVNLAFNLPFSLKNPWKSPGDRKKAEKKNCDEIADEHDISKYILKAVAKDYVPREIIARKKQPFPLPLQKWFKGEFLSEAKRLLLSEDSRIRIVADIPKLEKWIDRGVKSDDKGFGQKLWMLVSLELWLRAWF